MASSSLAGSSKSGAQMAQKTWQLMNKITETTDEIYKYNEEEQSKILAAKPWEKE